MMASFIAYAASGLLAFLALLLFIVSVFSSEVRGEKMRFGIASFVVLGFISWGFAYLGGL